MVQHYRRPKNTHRDSTKPPPPITKADTPTHKTNLQKNHQHPWLRRPPITEIQQSITKQEQKKEAPHKPKKEPQPTNTTNKPKQQQHPKQQTNQDNQGKTQPSKKNNIITTQKKTAQNQKRTQQVNTNTIQKKKTENNRKTHTSTKGTNMTITIKKEKLQVTKQPEKTTNNKRTNKQTNTNNKKSGKQTNNKKSRKPKDIRNYFTNNSIHASNIDKEEKNQTTKHISNRKQTKKNKTNTTSSTTKINTTKAPPNKRQNKEKHKEINTTKTTQKPTETDKPPINKHKQQHEQQKQKSNKQKTIPTQLDKRKYKKRKQSQLKHKQEPIMIPIQTITSSSSANIWKCPLCKNNNPNHTTTCAKCKSKITKTSQIQATTTNKITMIDHQAPTKDTRAPKTPQKSHKKHKEKEKRKRNKNEITISLNKEKIRINKADVQDLLTPGELVKGHILQTILKQAQITHPTNRVWIAPAALINTCITPKNQPLKTRWTAEENITIQPYKTNRVLKTRHMRQNTPPPKEITAIIINNTIHYAWAEINHQTKTIQIHDSASKTDYINRAAITKVITKFLHKWTKEKRKWHVLKPDPNYPQQTNADCAIYTCKENTKTNKAQRQTIHRQGAKNTRTHNKYK